MILSRFAVGKLSSLAFPMVQIYFTVGVTVMMANWAKEHVKRLSLTQLLLNMMRSLLICLAVHLSPSHWMTKATRTVGAV